tara:strand:+ start:455 stop:694 length:240 start_codon:yes stop_codon:yes gene_type:complete
MTVTYVKKVEVLDTTQIKRITIGTPVRKVTGAQAQEVGDLTNVDTTATVDNSVLQYNAFTAKYEAVTTVEGLTIDGGTF